MKFNLVIREPGSIEPDYSLDFETESLPRVGDYISIQRPDHPAPYGEDMIVRAVWWRLHHPETSGATDKPKIGGLQEIFVEAEPAVGPWSSDNWRAWAGSKGNTPELEVSRWSVGEGHLRGEGG